MEESIKTVKNSQVEAIEIVFPNDANPHGNVFGGRVMQLIDIIGSVSAMRHCRNSVVTASMDKLDFLSPAYVGEILIFQASVNFVARTSLEVGVKVTAENPLTGEHRHTASAYLTYVSIDKTGKPVQIPPILPETGEEKRRFEQAGKRREIRVLERAARKK
ncbi:acyl-CoA thioesterase [bacterium]|nr:acyl-CoA thioesterase [bacterium]MCI0603784.1 acyl-CoA thioesterase [bacterium]